MPNRTTTYKKENNIAVITVDSADGNRDILDSLSGELTVLCDEINADRDIRTIVLAGVGDQPFSMGNALNMKSTPNNVPEKKYATVADPIANLDQPVIAAISGDAVGPGLEMALACDVRLAGDTSRFGLPHLKNGFIPWDGGTQRLPRIVGKSKALEMILTGEMLNAREAFQAGLVSKVVPPGNLMDEALEIARKMASKGPIALRYAKEAVNKGMDLTIEQGLRLEADLYFLLHTTSDRTEGIKAFLAKRPGQFEGK